MPAGTDGYQQFPSCLSGNLAIVLLPWPAGPKTPPSFARWFLLVLEPLLLEMGRKQAAVEEDDHRPTIQDDAMRQAAGATRGVGVQNVPARWPAVLGWELAGFDHG